MGRRSSPEADIRRGIVKFLRMIGFAVYDLEQNRKTRQTPGIPDLYVQGKGIRFWVEVKTAKGRLSEAQADFKAEEEAHGGTVHVWRSSQEAFEWYENFRRAA